MILFYNANKIGVDCVTGNLPCKNDFHVCIVAAIFSLCSALLFVRSAVDRKKIFFLHIITGVAS